VGRSNKTLSPTRPNSDKPEFFNEIFSLIDRIGNDSYILCGEYNLVLDTLKDYFNYTDINNSKARDTVLIYIDQRDIVGPFREFYPTLRRYTWRKRTPLQQATLDFFLITSTLFHFVENVSITTSYQSDHFIVISNLKLDDF
jgi:exonuclease III